MEDEKINKDVLKVLTGVTNRLEVAYQLRGKALTKEEVFMPSGLLPAIAKRADQLCQLCFGTGIGVSFKESSKALLGVKVAFNEKLKIEAALCLADTMVELTRGTRKGIVVLDELLFDVL
ncbi:MAG: type IV secretion IcmS family protein [Pseudomonadota bacterium]|nr:type IV secretion IcmS family protein [Pseudomonadota bacterium]MEC8978219.1 type IV secretion IcmS family protein [Pseudomonadota bacterium]